MNASATSISEQAAGVGSAWWQWLVRPDPFADAWECAYENYAIFIVLFTAAHLILYVEPHRSFFTPFKFNKSYPESNLIVKEIGRSLRGVAICTAYDAAINARYRGMRDAGLTWRASSEIATWEVLLVILVLYAYGDTHFYWFHRMLHLPWLYKNVHKYHHESYNPDPFSGLSMHPIESAVYFSAAPFLVLVPGMPLYVYRLLKIGLLISPLNGHHGHKAVLEAEHHYIHHAKFNWNYGATMFWDRLCETDYDEARITSRRGVSTERMLEARKQAELVGMDAGAEAGAMKTKTKISKKGI